MLDSSISRRRFIIAGGASFAVSSAALSQTIPRPKITDENCVFCRIIAGKQSAFKIWEDGHFLAFLDHKPITPGHTLLVPRDHFEYLFEMPKAPYDAIMKRTRSLAVPIRSTMNSKRIGVIVEGFGVNHCHVHLVPINGSGELTQKGKTGVPDDEFRTVADRIRSAIGKGSE